MKTNELKLNEMEQTSGGNILDDVKDILKKIFPDPLKPLRPDDQTPVNPVIARG